jgi:hypothetical protein
MGTSRWREEPHASARHVRRRALVYLVGWLRDGREQPESGRDTVPGRHRGAEPFADNDAEPFADTDTYPDTNCGANSHPVTGSGC